MTVSENTTSPTSVSRRSLLGGAATTSLLRAAPSSAQAAPDPIVPLWEEWLRLRARAIGLCHRWQDIETHLMRKIGIPQVLIPSSNNLADFRAQSHAAIDRAVTMLPDSIEIAAALHVDFAKQQARCDWEAARLGLVEVKRQEDQAWDQEAQASEAIFHTHATSLAGIEIKIALIVELCSTGSDDPEFPLPQLQSTLADVKRLRRQFDDTRCSEPIVACP